MDSLFIDLGILNAISCHIYIILFSNSVWIFFLNCRSLDSDYSSGSDSESETESESDTESDSDSDVGKKSVKSKTPSRVVEKPQIYVKW